MESKVARAVFLMVTVLGMVAGQTCAASMESFRDCYGLCFLVCMIKPDHALFQCSYNCLKECLPSIPAIHHYCNLGCASSNCANISTKENPGNEAMEGCVHSCSDVCTGH